MRFGEPPEKSLVDLIETASRDGIAALQPGRLRATLRLLYAATIPECGAIERAAGKAK